jgi:hypothetical protein
MQYMLIQNYGRKEPSSSPLGSRPSVGALSSQFRNNRIAGCGSDRLPAKWRTRSKWLAQPARKDPSL